MTSALQKQYTYGKDEMPLYRTSIILAVLTTILAIGALVFAKHPALRSIAAIALIGVSVAVLVTFVLYPLLYRFFFFNRVKKGLSPVTFLLFVQSIFLFTYFALASVVVSVVMRSIFWAIPLPKTGKLHLFGQWMSWYMASVLYLKPQMSKRIFHQENLQNIPQAVYIANHTSFLDTLSMGMLNPDIIFVVNDWVYKSPVFGRAVNFLGFFPASQGVDGKLEELQKRIGDSFSVMVFPEGTRSTTSEIQRFHKGAFYIAEQLGLPIKPLYIHGNTDSLPKGDFIIYDSYSHIHVGEPILQSDSLFGTDYLQRTKSIGRYFREEFKNIRLAHESENYFRQKLLLNYLYKEQWIGKSVKKDFERHKKTYHALFDLIDEKANIAHITADLGQVDLLLVHQFPKRKVTTFNQIEEHRDISRSSYITSKFRVSYVSGLTDLWNKQEVLILSHLQQYEGTIPTHIVLIVALCSEVEKELINFELIRNEEHLKIYKRDETR